MAAIDWNYYVNNAAATTKAGDVIMCKKKKPKKWNCKVIKLKKKKYKYFVLMPWVLKFNKENGKMAAKPPVIPSNETGPALLTSTIADKNFNNSRREFFIARKVDFARKVDLARQVNSNN